LFAIGHGVTLYLLALFISKIAGDGLLQYGDTISSGVILLMGLYLVYLAATNKIRIDRHSHDDKEDFLIFGYLIYLINERMIRSVNSLRYATMFVGLFSISLGVYKLSELTTVIT